MKLLLHAIYTSPTQILSKAKSDAASLAYAIQQQDEQASRNALFNFAVTTYHVWDSVKSYEPDLDKDATNPLSQYEALRPCRDLSNANKHAGSIQTVGPTRAHPAIVDEFATSAKAQATTGETDRNIQTVTAGPAKWRFKVQLPSRRIAVEDLSQRGNPGLGGILHRALDCLVQPRHQARIVTPAAKESPTTDHLHVVGQNAAQGEVALLGGTLSHSESQSRPTVVWSSSRTHFTES